MGFAARPGTAVLPKCSMRPISSAGRHDSRCTFSSWNRCPSRIERYDYDLFAQLLVRYAARAFRLMCTSFGFLQIVSVGRSRIDLGEGERAGPLGSRGTSAPSSSAGDSRLDHPGGVPSWRRIAPEAPAAVSSNAKCSAGEPALAAPRSRAPRSSRSSPRALAPSAER